jgi:hypothetical protein
MPALLKYAGDAALLPSRFEKSAQHAVKRLQEQGFEARMSQNSPVWVPNVRICFKVANKSKWEGIIFWFDMRYRIMCAQFWDG